MKKQNSSNTVPKFSIDDIKKNIEKTKKDPEFLAIMFISDIESKVNGLEIQKERILKAYAEDNYTNHIKINIT